MRRAWQLGVVALGTGLALLLGAAGDALAFRDLLTVAGYAGGGLLLLVLPFFIPTGGRHRIRNREGLLVSVVALSLAVLIAHEVPADFGSRTSGTAVGAIVIAIAFLARVLWLFHSTRGPSGPAAPYGTPSPVLPRHRHPGSRSA